MCSTIMQEPTQFVLALNIKLNKKIKKIKKHIWENIRFPRAEMGSSGSDAAGYSKYKYGRANDIIIMPTVFV